MAVEYRRDKPMQREEMWWEKPQDDDLLIDFEAHQAAEAGRKYQKKFGIHTIVHYANKVNLNWWLRGMINAWNRRGYQKEKGGTIGKYKKGFAEEAWRNARFAKESYGLQHERGNLGSWKYMKGFSDDRLAVHTSGKNWHVAIRGSEMNLFDKPGRAAVDIAHDIKIAGGLAGTDAEYGRVNSKIKSLIGMHKVMGKGGKFEMSGHSLGGTMLNHMMSDPKIASHVTASHSFNPGSSPFGKTPKHPGHHHIHHNKNDIISTFTQADSGSTFHYHEGGLNPLSSAHWNKKWDSRDYWHEFEGDYEERSYEPPTQDAGAAAADIES